MRFLFGLRVAESHHDATPHWHGLLFTAPEHTGELLEVMEDYATREDAERANRQDWQKATPL